MGRQSEANAKHLKNPLLVDTSIWIDFFNNRKTKKVELLEEYIFNDSVVLLTPTIIQEILQGIRIDADYKKIKEIILRFHTLELNALEVAIGAADLYRSIRKKGVTIRKSNDCVIAFYAIYFKVSLLENDTDFKQISKYSELQLV